MLREIPIRPAAQLPHSATDPVALAARALLVQMRDRFRPETRQHLLPEVWMLNAALVRVGAEPVHFSREDAAAFGHWQSCWATFARENLR